MIGKRLAAQFPLTDAAAVQFDAFHALLTDWNKRMDLTAITDAEEALSRHYMDSLAAVDLLPPCARIIDVGTGAGFPGVPLKLARPDLDMTLLDAQRKRVDFLRHAIEQVPFEATAVHARAEDYARQHRECFDIAVSRAVAALPVLLEWMLPFVRVGGQCILYKGPGAMAELSQAEHVSTLLGGGEPHVREAVIPGQGWSHTLVIVKKANNTPTRFPRKAGMALKRPL